MIKKIIKGLLLVLFFFLLILKPVKAQENNKLNIYFFWSKACPHCVREKPFLDKLVEKYPQVELKSLGIDKVESIKLWQEAGEKLNIRIGSTPFTVIGTRHFTGYLSDETTGEQIEQAVKEALENGCFDIFKECEIAPQKTSSVPETISLPILGKIKTRSVSLPLLSIIIGVLDGFNPCAMWALLFLISLLLGMKDRLRMWILGITFIVVSAFVYFLFMTAWLNFFLFVGFISWVRIIIGLVALGAGGYSLREYYLNKNASCKVTSSKKRRLTFEKLKQITQKKEFLLALAGIIILAFAVNLVELVCSAGLPAVYTQVLSLSSLAPWQYYFYILIYVFFFMVDDLLVFFIAMITLKAIGVDSKYARFSRFFGGIIMLLLGILLLFKPEWLMFG